MQMIADAELMHNSTIVRYDSGFIIVAVAAYTVRNFDVR